MKKWVIVMCIVLFCVSCGYKKEQNVSDMCFDEFITGEDDSVALDNVLTRQYEIDELSDFFVNSNINENIGFGVTTSALSFSEVNEKFPVEIIRSRGYSVYKVSEGGYFYVFWTMPAVSDENQKEEELSVYFTAYIPARKKQNNYDSLSVGKSTATDVKSIDPYVEFSFLLSCGIFSHSYIDDTSVLQIEYLRSEEIHTYDDLVVKEIVVISRDTAPSKYASIQSNDLPYDA